jgi:hypothetical protein
MALKIRNNANPDLIGDIQPGWSIDENATPHVIGDGSASVGGVQFSAARRDDSEFLLNKPVTVYYEAEGTVAAGNNVTGVFDSVDTSGAGVGATSTNLLSALTAERSIPPILPLTNKLRTITGTNTGGNSADLGYWPRYDSTKQMVAAIDRDYTFETGARAVIKYYDHTGTIVSRTVLTGGSFVALTFPFEIDNIGRFYVSDQANKTISVFSPTGAFLTSWSSPTTDDFGFTTIKYNPFDDNIWVVDNTSRVRAFTKGGGVVRNWKTYDNVFQPSQGVGVRASDISFTANAVHAAQVNGIYAYSSTGSPLYSTLYEDIDYSNGNAPKALEIDRYGNYVLAIIGRLYVYGQRGSVLSKTGQLSGLPNTTASSDYGLAITPDGHYFVGVEQVGGVASFQIFAGSPLTLRGYVYSVLNSILPNILNVTYSGSNPPSVYPGWADSVWTKLNELCAATGKEIVLQNDALLVRDIASSSVTVDNFVASPSVSAAATDAVRAITVVNQNASVVTNNVIYDYRTEQSAPISVAVGQTTFVRIETPVSLVSVQQPAMSPGSVGIYPSDGQFFVFDRDGINIGSASYQRAGMSLRAQIDPEDSTAIILQIVGPRVNIDATQGPYTIGSIVGDGKATGISIIGSGVKVNPEPITIYTGANPSIVSTEFGQTINNVFISDSNAVYSRGAWAVASLNGVSQVLNITIPTDSIGGLGVTPGSTFIYRKCRWRVLTSKFQNATIALTAQPYTTVGEHDGKYSGQTVGSHDAILASLTLGDSALKPLY